METVICECGKSMEIDWWNGCNEEGEEYGLVTAYCDCGKEYEASQWREWENEDEALEAIKDKIKQFKQPDL